MKKKNEFISVILIMLLVFTSCTSNNNSSSKESKSKKQTNLSQKTQENTNKDTASENKSDSKAGNSTLSNNNVQTPKAEVQKASKVIVIDPGHANRSNLEKEPLSPGSAELKIKDGGGAQGVVTKTPEYEINMKVSLKLKTLLEQSVYKVVMTKTDNSTSLGNIDRANIGNNANANLVIRIHADSSDNWNVSGASMLVPAVVNDNTKSIYAESKRCGTILLNTLISEVGMQNRGVVEHSDMTGFNWSRVPVVLVEMGFLSNSNEDRLLSSEDYQNKLAKALFDGIVAAEN